MSRMFEALSRGQASIPDFPLQPLMEGQPDEYLEPLPPPAPKTSVAKIESPAPDPKEAFPFAAVRMLPLKLEPSSPMLPFDGTHWRASEQYRMLRTKLLLHPKKPQVIVFTSAGPSDGKSVNVINAAGALALKNDASVLLLDGDFRRSTISTKLGVPATPGLADVLAGNCSLQDALVRSQQIPNLYILPASQTEGNPTELLDSDNWRTLIKTCRGVFRYIIMDSPPMGTVADYDLLQAVCDGVVLVFRPDHTDRKAGLATLQTVPKDKLLGVVMNCVTDWFLDKNSQYDSYYYK